MLWWRDAVNKIVAMIDGGGAKNGEPWRLFKMKALGNLPPKKFKVNDQG